ncbi:hypothetical protein pb186bvf_005816 [Paramecium bursaria]
MTDTNYWELGIFITFITLDVTSILVIIWKFRNLIINNDSNYHVPIAIIITVCLLLVVTLVQKFNFFYIFWIQIAFSIINTILSLGYIWKLRDQNKSKQDQNREQKVLLVGDKSNQSRDQLSNYGFYLELQQATQDNLHDSQKWIHKEPQISSQNVNQPHVALKIQVIDSIKNSQISQKNQTQEISQSNSKNDSQELYSQKINVLDQIQSVRNCNDQKFQPPQNQNDNGKNNVQQQSKNNVTADSNVPVYNAQKLSQENIVNEVQLQPQEYNISKVEQLQQENNVNEVYLPPQDQNIIKVEQLQQENNVNEVYLPPQDQNIIEVEQLQQENNVNEVNQPPQYQNIQKFGQLQQENNVEDQQLPPQDQNIQKVKQLQQENNVNEIKQQPQEQNIQKVGQLQQENNVEDQQLTPQDQNIQKFGQLQQDNNVEDQQLPPQDQNIQKVKQLQQENNVNEIKQQPQEQNIQKVGQLQQENNGEVQQLTPQDQNIQKFAQLQQENNVCEVKLPPQNQRDQFEKFQIQIHRDQIDQDEKQQQQQLNENFNDKQQSDQNSNPVERDMQNLHEGNQDLMQKQLILHPIPQKYEKEYNQTNDKQIQMENVQDYNQDKNFQNNQSYQIINQKFYIPSFKQRLVEDEYLKKFVRDFKNIQSYQEEYNLDDSQNELLQNQIKYYVPIRGDGNCMFTSLGLQYLYFNLIDEQKYQRLLNLIDSTEFKQNLEVQSVETEEDQDILRQEFKFQLERLKEFKDHQLLQAIADNINNAEGPFYGLLIIFMRNYFRKILQEFYDNSEMNFLIQEPDQINEIITWEFMYNEAQIALKLFATKEQILILGYQKLNVEDKTVQIEEYKDDDQNDFKYKIGLAFQPGHYNFNEFERTIILLQQK